MPTLIGSVQRLELNQSSRVPTKEQLSGEKLVLWQGLAARIEGAIFNDDPSESSIIDVFNLASVNIVVRKNNANGNILFTKEVTAFTPTSYAAWIAETEKHFVFELDEIDTTQIVPQSGRLPIYFVVTAVTNDDIPYIAGFGSGEIVDVGFIDNPISTDYVNGRTPIVGGRLLSDFDLNGRQIIDSSGFSYAEEGSVVLTTGQLEVNVDFLFEKLSADGYRFDYAYIRDSNTFPSDIRPILKSQTTTGFTMELSGEAVAGTILFWKVIPKATVPTPIPVARYIDSAGLDKKATSPFVFYASKIGAVLNSNVMTGGGTDDSTVLNVILAYLGTLGRGVLILDGAALITVPLRVPSNVTIYCLNKSCGVYLVGGANCPMVTNSNFTSVTNPHEPLVGARQRNISIVGGTWNGNYLGQAIYVNNNAANSWVCGMWFNGVDNFRLRNATIYDARKFGLMLTYPGNSDMINYTAEYPVNRQDNNDAFHVWGPATGRITIRNIRAINTSDDVIALNYCESRAGMVPSTGEVDFTGRDAAISTLVDGVYIENGHAILRVDGTSASVGSVIVRHVDASFNIAAAVLVLGFGTWKKLLCEDWVMEVPAGAANAIPKGAIIDNPRNGSVTEFRKWRHTADGSVHPTDTQRNSLITVVTGDLGGGETAAAKIILDDIIVDKPATPRSGVLLYIKGNATGRVVDEVIVRNSTLLSDGYGYVVQNDLSANIVGRLSLPDNTLNGATPIIGNRPVNGLEKPAARVLNSAAVAILNATLTIIPFDSERFDTDTIHDTVTNNSRLTCRTAGKYMITANIAYDINATGYRVTRFLVNGTTEIARDVRIPLTASDYTVSFTTTIYHLNVGDYVEVQCYQTSGGGLNVQPITNSSPEFSMAWLGP